MRYPVGILEEICAVSQLTSTSKLLKVDENIDCFSNLERFSDFLCLKT